MAAIEWTENRISQPFIMNHLFGRMAADYENIKILKMYKMGSGDRSVILLTIFHFVRFALSLALSHRHNQNGGKSGSIRIGRKA